MLKYIFINPSTSKKDKIWIYELNDFIKVLLHYVECCINFWIVYINLRKHEGNEFYDFIIWIENFNEFWFPL